jgi:hypothetical protein
VYRIETGFSEQCAGGNFLCLTQEIRGDGEKHNEELYGLYFSPDTIETIKSKTYGRKNM